MTLSKQCTCANASASGPRVVPIAAPHLGDDFAYHFVYAWVPMACDYCDMPWVRGPKDEP